MDNNTDPSFKDIENEPTPYSVGSGRSSPENRKVGESAQEKRKKIIFAIVLTAVIVCAAGFLIVYAMEHPMRPSPPSHSSSAPLGAGAAEASPAIVISLQKTADGARLAVQWNDLPGNTTKINIYYSPTKDGAYLLVGGVPVASSTAGMGFLTVPDGDQGGYYYGVGVGGDGSPLWISSSTLPGNSSSAGNNSSTPSSSNQGSGSGGGGGNLSSGDNGNGSGTGGNTKNGSGTNSSTTDNGNGTQGSDGGGNDASSAPTENFVVQHVDEKIQIGWQSLPANTFQIVVSRSSSDDGPWTAVLTETNITTDGPYAILIVDDTLGDPYYYKMDAEDEDGNIIITYGPTLLQPLPM